nr:hypothetical protein [Tanacetum cinerariifolium]
MPLRADLSFGRLDNSVFKSKVSETIASVPKIKTNASKTTKDSLKKLKTVRSSAPIIEDWESDSEDENVFEPKEVKKIVKPSLEKIEFVNARNTTVENKNKAEKPKKFSQSPKGNKRNWNGLMTQKLGDIFEFKKKTCFVCKSINHLIKDCDFYENKMVMNNKGKITGPNEIRPVCDNTTRVNHQNKLIHPHPKRNFVLAAVLTKSGQVPVNAAKQSSHRVVLSVSAAMHVNTVASRTSVNNATYSYFKAHSPVRRPFYQKSAAKTNNFNEKVNTANVNNVSTDGSKAVVSAAKGNWNNDQGIFNSGCSRHMTGNKFYLLDYKEIDGGFLIDESQVLLKVPRNNMYSFDLKNVVPVGVVTDDFSRFTWVFFLATKDETLEILKNFIACIENQMDHKVQTIRSDNETEFKNRIMKEFCKMKEEARTMLEDSKLPTTFWAEAVNTACYVQTKVLGIKPHNKTLYKLFIVVSPIPTTRISKDHPNEQIIGNSLSALQTRRMTKTTQKQAMVSYIKRIEAIKLILAYASFMGFIMYQMDVKSAFLYGTIEKELYVCQPFGFEDPYFPNNVYKVKKALYGLHQALRAWYETLSTYLLENGFRRGIIDKTLFIKKNKGDILLVQVYVDDIKKYLCTEFEGLIHKKFQMSSIGELTFFLALHVLQKDDGIFISQDKSMIGSLMYLTAFRPDIMFAVCACARFQVIPKVSHLHVVKRIFRYLKGQPKLGLWYPRDFRFNLEAFSDSDFAGASLDRKSTTGGC